MTPPTSGTLLREAEIGGRIVDVRIRSRRVAEIGSRLDPGHDEVIHVGGGGVLPGLHDHHLHLHALAATHYSVDVGPPTVTDRAEFVEALRTAAATAPAGGWIRGVGYHESVAGPLDRFALDDLQLGVPVRIQHRSGALWILDSSALRYVGRRIPLSSDDVERGHTGAPNGRLWRFDTRLRAGLPPTEASQHADALRAVRERLLGHGVTGVTDATPDLEPGAVLSLSAVRPLHVHLLGAPAGAELGPGFTRGARKLLLRDHDLPDFDSLCDMIDPAGRGPGREPVAVHCVTRESLILTLAALRQVGTHPRDRIEHASVAPPELDPLMLEAGLTVVTQPDFIRTRGDQYLATVDPDDLPCLYRWATLEAAGVPVAASSDAPYGDPDPWAVIRSAQSRVTDAGVVVGASESVAGHQALGSLLRPLDDPGGPPRTVVPGAPADLCILDRSTAEALEPDGGSPVRLTVIDGSVVWSR